MKQIYPSVLASFFCFFLERSESWPYRSSHSSVLACPYEAQQHPHRRAHPNGDALDCSDIDTEDAEIVDARMEAWN